MAIPALPAIKLIFHGHSRTKPTPRWNPLLRFWSKRTRRWVRPLVTQFVSILNETKPSGSED